MEEFNKLELIKTTIINFFKSQKNLNSNTVEIPLENVTKDQTELGIKNAIDYLNTQLRLINGGGR